MTDLEKVIKGLEQFKADFKPFCGNDADWARVDDAIDLLKEQEPIEPSICGTPGGYSSWWYLCGKCKKPIDHKDRFCRRCGQEVKWE